MPQASPAPQARKALSELLAIAEQESALIIKDDLESLVELHPKKAPLQEQFSALQLSSLSPAEGDELAKVLQQIVDINERNFLELKRRRADVAKSMEQMSRLHEFSEGVQRTIDPQKGRLRDTVA